MVERSPQILTTEENATTTRPRVAVHWCWEALKFTPWIVINPQKVFGKLVTKKKRKRPVTDWSFVNQIATAEAQAYVLRLVQLSVGWLQFFPRLLRSGWGPVLLQTAVQWSVCFFEYGTVKVRLLNLALLANWQSVIWHGQTVGRLVLCKLEGGTPLLRPF